MAIKGDVFLALQFKSQPTRGGGEEKESGDSRTGLEFSQKKISLASQKKPRLGSVPPPLFRSNGEDLLPKFSQGRGARLVCAAVA